MKKLLFLAGFLCFLETQSQNIIRVVNGQNLQTIINNATAGDILMVEAGTYGSININKKLELIGTGYFLNNDNSAYVGESILGTVLFSPGAELASIQGFIANEIYIGANSVLVQRNKTVNIVIGSGNTNGISNLKADNVIVKHNFSTGTMYVYHNSINFLIKNNIFGQSFIFHSTAFGQVLYNNFYSYLSNNDGYYLEENNLLIQFKNNIFSGFSSVFIHLVVPFIVEKNVFKNDYPAISSKNKVNVDFTNMYLGYPNNPNNLQEDARNQLAPNSPAKGAGEGGTDAGAFGGDEPYILSGIPAIPTIYQLTVPANVPQNGTLNVTIKAKTNN